MKQDRVVAVNLNRTLAQGSGPGDFGEPTDGAADAMRELKEQGFTIAINSVVGDVEKIKAWLDQHGIAYDYVNESPAQPDGSSDKLNAVAYVDDRAIPYRGDWRQTLDDLYQCGVLDKRVKIINAVQKAAGDFWVDQRMLEGDDGDELADEIEYENEHGPFDRSQRDLMEDLDDEAYFSGGDCDTWFEDSEGSMHHYLASEDTINFNPGVVGFTLKHEPIRVGDVVIVEGVGPARVVDEVDQFNILIEDDEGRRHTVATADVELTGRQIKAIGRDQRGANLDIGDVVESEGGRGGGIGHVTGSQGEILELRMEDGSTEHTRGERLLRIGAPDRPEAGVIISGVRQIASALGLPEPLDLTQAIRAGRSAARPSAMDVAEFRRAVDRFGKARAFMDTDAMAAALNTAFDRVLLKFEGGREFQAELRQKPEPKSKALDVDKIIEDYKAWCDRDELWYKGYPNLEMYMRLEADGDPRVRNVLAQAFDFARTGIGVDANGELVHEGDTVMTNRGPAIAKHDLGFGMAVEDDDGHEFLVDPLTCEVQPRPKSKANRKETAAAVGKYYVLQGAEYRPVDGPFDSMAEAFEACEEWSDADDLIVAERCIGEWRPLDRYTAGSADPRDQLDVDAKHRVIHPGDTVMTPDGPAIALRLTVGGYIEYETDDGDTYRALPWHLEVQPRPKAKYIRHQGNEWVVHARDGRVLGRHGSKEDAQRQLDAIHVSQHKGAENHLYEVMFLTEDGRRRYLGQRALLSEARQLADEAMMQRHGNAWVVDEGGRVVYGRPQPVDKAISSRNFERLAQQLGVPLSDELVDRINALSVEEQERIYAKAAYCGSLLWHAGHWKVEEQFRDLASQIDDATRTLLGTEFAGECMSRWTRMNEKPVELLHELAETFGLEIHGNVLRKESPNDWVYASVTGDVDDYVIKDWLLDHGADDADVQFHGENYRVVRVKTLNRDERGNYVSWTGRESKPKRTYGNRFEVLHSSASGWYVFDCRDDRTVASGLSSEGAARIRAQEAADAVTDKVDPMLDIAESLARKFNLRVWNSGTPSFDRGWYRVVITSDVRPPNEVIEDYLRDSGASDVRFEADPSANNTLTVLYKSIDKAALPSTRANIIAALERAAASIGAQVPAVTRNVVETSDNDVVSRYANDIIEEADVFVRVINNPEDDRVFNHRMCIDMIQNMLERFDPRAAEAFGDEFNARILDWRDEINMEGIALLDRAVQFFEANQSNRWSKVTQIGPIEADWDGFPVEESLVVKDWLLDNGAEDVQIHARPNGIRIQLWKNIGKARYYWDLPYELGRIVENFGIDLDPRLEQAIKEDHDRMDKIDRVYDAYRELLGMRLSNPEAVVADIVRPLRRLHAAGANKLGRDLLRAYEEMVEAPHDLVKRAVENFGGKVMSYSSKQRRTGSAVVGAIGLGDTPEYAIHDWLLENGAQEADVRKRDDGSVEIRFKTLHRDERGDYIPYGEGTNKRIDRDHVYGHRFAVTFEHFGYFEVIDLRDSYMEGRFRDRDDAIEHARSLANSVKDDPLCDIAELFAHKFGVKVHSFYDNPHSGYHEVTVPSGIDSYVIEDFFRDNGASDVRVDLRSDSARVHWKSIDKASPGYVENLIGRLATFGRRFGVELGEDEAREIRVAAETAPAHEVDRVRQLLVDDIDIDDLGYMDLDHAIYPFFERVQLCVEELNESSHDLVHEAARAFHGTWNMIPVQERTDLSGYVVWDVKFEDEVPDGVLHDWLLEHGATDAQVVTDQGGWTRISVQKSVAKSATSLAVLALRKMADAVDADHGIIPEASIEDTGLSSTQIARIMTYADRFVELNFRGSLTRREQVGYVHDVLEEVIGTEQADGWWSGMMDALNAHRNRINERTSDVLRRFEREFGIPEQMIWRRNGEDDWAEMYVFKDEFDVPLGVAEDWLKENGAHDAEVVERDESIVVRVKSVEELL